MQSSTIAFINTPHEIFIGRVSVNTISKIP